MEKSENTKSFIDFFKNIGLAFGKLLNDGEVDDSVELTGDLAKDPIVAVESFQNSYAEASHTQTRVSPSKPRTTRVQNRVSKPVVKDNDEELDK